MQWNSLMSIIDALNLRYAFADDYGIFNRVYVIWAKKNDASSWLLIQQRTEYFQPARTCPYVENWMLPDSTDPYAQSFDEAEAICYLNNPENIVLRTGWFI